MHLCIGTKKTRSEEKRLRYYGNNFYLKSGDEMAALFPDYPEAISNTVRIAGRCITHVPDMKMKDLLKFLPDFEIPEGFENGDTYLRHLAMEGLARRYAKEKTEGGDKWREIEERFEYELDVIIRMGFTGYFLIVADFINWAKERNIPVGPGRGSGAGSIVAYSLRITNIDPLKYKLLFERFLNAERISMPDFDVDFAREGRDEVIRYVAGKYGRDRVGQIITFGTLKAKQVIKDVARVLGIKVPESDMITKLIPKDPKITLAKAIDGEPRLQELEKNPGYEELFALARKLEGLHRQAGLHAAGVVIGKIPLIDLVPLYQDRKTGVIATQYSMNFLESCGLVKMDFLGLKTLDAIKRSEEMIRLRGGEFSDFSIEEVPEDDEATFKMLGEGKSFEIFQFESDGMQNILKRTKPASIEDLISLNSLYRPGPMASIDRFIDSKNGRQHISYPDPSLEEVLKDTYGVIAYQEQVMQTARIVAGYTLGQADKLRKAMGKKIKEIIDAEKIPFLEGASKRGYTKAKAEEIFDTLAPFAGYGFNKCHAAAYSVVAYQTAYLKANFPAEFMAANLTNEIGAQDDKLAECIAETRKMGLEIAPPDINNSQKLFTVVDGCIVYGFLGIKGLGEGPAEEIVNCRQEGPYRDFMDFLNRVDIKAVGKSMIELLIQTGAFDSFGTRRETLLGNLERAVEYVQNIKEDKKFGQASLFGDTDEKEYGDFEFENFPEKSRQEKLDIEKRLIGFYSSGHPMDEYRELWERVVKVDLGRPETLVPGQGNGNGPKPGSQILIGLIKNIKVITTSRGDKMAYVTLEDYNGEMEMTFFRGPWEKCRDKIEADKVVILRGKLDYQYEKDKLSFLVDEYLEADDVERVIKEEEAEARKWDKYRNIGKYAAEMDLQLLDLAAPAKAKKGTYTAIGIVKSLKTIIDRKGREMAFGTLQDYRGEVDLRFYSRTWENCKALVALDEILALRGIIDPPNDKNPLKPGLEVSSILDINRLVRSAAKKASELSGKAQKPKPEAGAAAVHIRLAANAAENEEGLRILRDYLEENPGACPVYIHVPVQSAEMVIRATELVNAGVPAEAWAKCAAVAYVWVA